MTMRQLKQLNQVAKVLMGQAPPSSACSEDRSGLPFIQGNAEFGTRYSTPRLWCSVPTRICEKGDFLLSVRAPVGALNQSNLKMVIGRGLSAIRFTDYDQPFAWHSLKSAVHKLDRVSQGSTFVAVNRHDVECLEIPWFPGNYYRQNVAYVLDTIDETIAKTEEMINKLKQVRAGMLHDLLSYGLDEHGQLRDPIAHPEQFKDSPLGRIPMEWETEQLGNLFDLGRGRVISQQDLLICPGLYPVYSSQSANEGIFGYLGTFDFEGDYITWTTDGANAGTVFYRSGRFNCTNVCGTLKSQGRVREHFGALAFARESKKHVSYVGNPKLMNNIVSHIRISFPKSKDEQQIISDSLNSFDDVIAKENSEYHKLLALKYGIQDDLLSGRVRIPETIMQGAGEK